VPRLPRFSEPPQNLNKSLHRALIEP
jgi:hypothetical protein